MCECRRVLWRWRTSGREVAEAEVGKESIVKGWRCCRDGKSKQQKALGVEGTTLEKVKKERTVLAQDDKCNIWKRKSCVDE